MPLGNIGQKRRRGKIEKRGKIEREGENIFPKKEKKREERRGNRENGNIWNKK